MYGEAIRNEVRYLVSLGVPKTEIMKKFGIKSRSTLYTILNETPRTIARAGATAPINIEIRNIQNNRQAPSLIDLVLMRRTQIMIGNIQSNSENLRDAVEEIDKMKEEVNEIKESTENLWMLWACIIEMYNRIKEIKSDIEFLTIGNLANSILINNLKSQIPCWAETIKIQNKIDLERLESKFNDKLRYQNIMQDSKEIKEWVQQKNQKLLFFEFLGSSNSLGVTL